MLNSPALMLLRQFHTDRPQRFAIRTSIGQIAPFCDLHLQQSGSPNERVGSHPDKLNRRSSHRPVRPNKRCLTVRTERANIEDKGHSVVPPHQTSSGYR
jgi:hypothetical protein